MPMPSSRMALLAAILIVLATSSARSEVSMENGIDRKGRDYTRFVSPSAEACRQTCDRDRRCAAFTWVRPNTIQGPRGNCWLKSSVPPQIAHHCCVSGVKTGSESDRARVEGNYPPGCAWRPGETGVVEPRASLRVTNASRDTIVVDSLDPRLAPGQTATYRYHLRVGRHRVCWSIVSGRATFSPQRSCVTVTVTNLGPRTCSVVRHLTYR